MTDTEIILSLRAQLWYEQHRLRWIEQEESALGLNAFDPRCRSVATSQRMRTDGVWDWYTVYDYGVSEYYDTLEQAKAAVDAWWWSLPENVMPKDT